MFQLEKNTQILDAGQICLPTGEFDRIQYVAAYFLEGKTPESWKDSWRMSATGPAFRWRRPV